MEKETVRSVEQGFYDACAEILGITHQYKERFYRTNRWNNRMPGNGRFEGFGLIRMYALDIIHVSFQKPTPVNRRFTSRDAVLEFLKTIPR